MVIRGIHLSVLCRNMVVSFVVVWWLLYAVHRAVFEVHRIYFIRRLRKILLTWSRWARLRGLLAGKAGAGTLASILSGGRGQLK